jgi:hypothetical protein
MTTRRGHERAAAWERRRPDVVAPVFFVGKDLHTPRVTLTKGHLWEYQDRRFIRGWSESYGLPDDGRPWDQLPFVTTLLCPTLEIANEIVAKGMTLDEAQQHVDQWLEANVT